MTGNEPPAGTPPAADPAAGGQQTPAADPGKTLTQAEVDAIVKARLARDREALERDLGMSLKDAKALAAAKKKADDDAKSEVEKLTGERDQHKTEAEKFKLEAVKLRALVKAKADPEKIDSLLKRVVGNTPEEIEADVLQMAADGLFVPKTPQGAQGAGNPGLQGTTEPDLWTQIAEAEKVAIKSGSAEDWKKVNRLKAKAYKF